MRISREVMFMEIANVVSKRSTCFRLNVGAVIVHRRRIVSIGYNGRSPGEPHCQGNECPGRFACQETTHAEANALQWLPEEDANFPIEYMDLYCTDSPCQACARLIIRYKKIDRVFFQRPYRITDGLDDLIEAGIKVFQVMPSGYVIDWKEKEIVA